MKQLIVYSLLLVSFVTFAQQKDKFLPKGNEAFAEKKYADAEAEYRISESKNPKKVKPTKLKRHPVNQQVVDSVKKS